MTTYRKIHGRSIQAVTTDPSESVAEGQVWYNTSSDTFKSVVSLEAWSSGAPTTEDKPNLASGAGTQTAGLIAGGKTPASTITNEYNGTSHSVGGALNNGGFARNMGGTQTAGFCYGNQVSSPDFPTAECEQYNGTAWTTITNVPQVTSNGGSFGSTTAGVVFSGRINNNDDCNTVTSEYNGSSWTSGGAFPAAMRGIGSATGAPATDGISMGGQVQPGGAKQTTVNKYDGTSWTAETGIPTATSFASGSGANSDDALIFGGNAPSVTANTFGYNGTSWTAKPSMATARNNIGGAGTTTAAIAMGGNSPGSDNLTEEFNVSANVITAAAWSSGATKTTSTTQQEAGTDGPRDAFAIWGGRTVPAITTNLTEEFNGASWTAGGTLGTAARKREGGGTLTAAWCANGEQPDYIDNVEEYDGTSWSEVNNTPAASSFIGGSGPQTAGIVCLGQLPGGAYPKATLEYDGTNWTSGGNTSTGRQPSSAGQVGPQTAALISGGEPTPIANTEQYDGTSWSEVADLITALGQASDGTFGIQTAAIQCGGKTSPSPGAAVTTSQSWNGTNWSTSPSLGQARKSHSSSGSSTAGLTTAGQTTTTPTVLTSSEEYDGETTAINVKTLTQS